jgi:hypothetical protein
VGGEQPVGSHSLGYQVAGIGDFNNDGTSDVVRYNSATRDVDEWLIKNGALSSSVDFGAYPDSGSQIAGVGDFNGDGSSDVLWFNPGTGATDIWELRAGKWAASSSPGRIRSAIRSPVWGTSTAMERAMCCGLIPTPAMSTNGRS